MATPVSRRDFLRHLGLSASALAVGASLVTSVTPIAETIATWPREMEALGQFAVVSADYEEFAPETYRGIEVALNGGDYRFASGDFEVDLEAAQTWLGENHIPPMVSSTIDNFRADIARRLIP